MPLGRRQCIGSHENFRDCSGLFPQVRLSRLRPQRRSGHRCLLLLISGRVGVSIGPGKLLRGQLLAGKLPLGLFVDGLTIALVAVWVEVTDCDVAPYALSNSYQQRLWHPTWVNHPFLPLMRGQSFRESFLCTSIWQCILVMEHWEPVVGHIRIWVEEITLCTLCHDYGSQLSVASERTNEMD